MQKMRGSLRVRSQFGVLAFGADSDVRTAFETCDITEFDLHALEARRLWHDSTERGLLCDALIKAFERNRSLRLVGGHPRHLAPANPRDAAWKPLKKLVHTLDGTIGGHPDLRWHEGIVARLDWAHDQLWLLIEPRTVFEGRTDENEAVAANFSRERTVKRYNYQLNQIIDFWTRHLAGGKNEIRALNVGDGVDAVFRLSSVTGYSRRILS